MCVHEPSDGSWVCHHNQRGKSHNARRQLEGSRVLAWLHVCTVCWRTSAQDCHGQFHLHAVAVLVISQPRMMVGEWVNSAVAGSNPSSCIMIEFFPWQDRCPLLYMSQPVCSAACNQCQAGHRLVLWPPLAFGARLGWWRMVGLALVALAKAYMCHIYAMLGQLVVWLCTASAQVAGAGVGAHCHACARHTM